MKKTIIKWLVFILLLTILFIIPYTGLVISIIIAWLGKVLLVILFGMDFFIKTFNAIRNFFGKIKNFFTRKK